MSTGLIDPKTSQNVLLYVNGCSKPQSGVTGKWKEGQGISPSAWLTEDVDDKVNMVRKEWPANGLVIPYWENTKLIKKLHRLCIAKNSNKRKAVELTRK